MKFWVGITDSDWFEFLSHRQPGEVNFWQPSPRPVAGFLEAGVPFLFKLHSPRNFIAGGGFFVRFSALPARLAWEAFGENNGAPDHAVLKRRVERYRKTIIRGDPEIGCNILNAPFFWPEQEWIPTPASWERNIVRGRTFDTTESDESKLWNDVEARFVRRPLSGFAAEESARFGAEYLTQARLGQGAFRVLVTEAYERRCAVTGERTLPVLEAAHIKPFAQSGPHLVSNGLLLRSDIHTLFDQGYVTVAEDFRVEVSKRIKEEFENGREYYAHHGKPLVELPLLPDERPRREFLRWHNGHVYLG
jgi:putative restriction endonuclease